MSYPQMPDLTSKTVPSRSLLSAWLTVVYALRLKPSHSNTSCSADLPYVVHAMAFSDSLWSLAPRVLKYLCQAKLEASVPSLRNSLTVI